VTVAVVAPPVGAAVIAARALPAGTTLIVRSVTGMAGVMVGVFALPVILAGMAMIVQSAVVMGQTMKRLSARPVTPAGRARTAGPQYARRPAGSITSAARQKLALARQAGMTLIVRCAAGTGLTL
jgi:hypothetical protein